MWEVTQYLIFKLYYRATVRKKKSMVLTQKQIQWSIELNRRPRNKPTQLKSFDFLTKEPETHIGEKTTSLTIGAGYILTND
jgi:hypothetical protein